MKIDPKKSFWQINPRGLNRTFAVCACDIDLGNLLRRLEQDSLIAIDWFENNYMKLNREKCHFLFSGNKHEHLFVRVGEHQIWESQSEKILGVTIDTKLKFENHVENILVPAGKKLSALVRISTILSFSKLRILLKSFVESQYAYCPLIWMFCSWTLNTRINKLHERAPRILYRDDVSSFEEIVERDKSIHERYITLLAVELYNVKYGILPNALGDFILRRDLCYNLRNVSSFIREKVNTTYWDIFPTDLKEAGNLGCFKTRIKNWKVENFPCYAESLSGGLGFLWCIIYSVILWFCILSCIPNFL